MLWQSKKYARVAAVCARQGTYAAMCVLSKWTASNGVAEANRAIVAVISADV
jgi:hypothetical protein